MRRLRSQRPGAHRDRQSVWGSAAPPSIGRWPEPMAEGGRKRIPAEALINLRRRLDTLPPRNPERRNARCRTPPLYGVSRATLYGRCSSTFAQSRSVVSIAGKPRKLRRPRWSATARSSPPEAADKQQEGPPSFDEPGHRMLEGDGVETPEGLVRLPPDMLTRTTVNRYLRDWGYDHARMTRAPAAVRFQARRSNELWQFDLSPSDLKEVEKPLWFEPGRGNPTLMLYSVVDDRSGVATRNIAASMARSRSGFRFLFNAMAPNPTRAASSCRAFPMRSTWTTGRSPESGVPERHGVPRHPSDDALPAGKDGRRVTARSKGKVERPFRTVKEAHETLYHFHRPENEAEANLWLHRYLAHYNGQPHRIEPHSRLEDWLRHLPEQACGRCAPGNVSARSPASRSGAWSAAMRG